MSVLLIYYPNLDGLTLPLNFSIKFLLRIPCFFFQLSSWIPGSTVNTSFTYLRCITGMLTFFGLISRHIITQDSI